MLLQCEGLSGKEEYVFNSRIRSKVKKVFCWLTQWLAYMYIAEWIGLLYTMLTKSETTSTFSFGSTLKIAT